MGILILHPHWNNERSGEKSNNRIFRQSLKSSQACSNKIYKKCPCSRIHRMACIFYHPVLAVRYIYTIPGKMSRLLRDVNSQFRWWNIIDSSYAAAIFFTHIICYARYGKPGSKSLPNSKRLCFFVYIRFFCGPEKIGGDYIITSISFFRQAYGPDVLLFIECL